MLERGHCQEKCFSKSRIRPSSFTPKSCERLLKDFNLLVSSARGNEHEANSEIRYLLGEVGDDLAETGLTPVSGLTVARTMLDPISAVNKLRPMLLVKPWQFRYILKIKPIMRVVPSDIQLLCDAVGELAQVLGSQETFRISLEKRHSSIESRKLIDEAAKRVPRKVDLIRPNKIIIIEILGDLSGLSVLSPTDILAVGPEKRRVPA